MYPMFFFQARKPAKGLSSRGKGKKRKQILKLAVDCTHPVEDGIMDVANFVSEFLYSTPPYFAMTL